MTGIKNKHLSVQVLVSIGMLMMRRAAPTRRMEPARL
jgi:hypothetical protein